MAEMPAGAHMAAEIEEQPAVWQSLLDGAEPGVSEVVRAIGERPPRFVLLAARGSSDHAALYAKYLVEVLLGLPAGLVSPSTFGIYGARPDLRDVLMLGVSQSGVSPDLVRAVEVARAGGASTVAVTNDPGSPLALAAEMDLDVAAGAERSVAATKSYTAQLLALYLLLSRLAGRSHGADRLPGWGAEMLAQRAQVTDLADRYRTVDRMVVTARGFSYATAREAALKLMETSYISAQAFSGADLLHGPMALIDHHVPVIAVAGPGKSGDAMRPVLETLRRTGADVLCVGTHEHVGEGSHALPLPAGLAEELAPIVEILPLQQLALHVALGRGENPDTPRGLAKVTQTL